MRCCFLTKCKLKLIFRVVGFESKIGSNLLALISMIFLRRQVHTNFITPFRISRTSHDEINQMYFSINLPYTIVFPSYSRRYLFCTKIDNALSKYYLIKFKKTYSFEILRLTSSLI